MINKLQWLNLGYFDFAMGLTHRDPVETIFKILNLEFSQAVAGGVLLSPHAGRQW